MPRIVFSIGELSGDILAASVLEHLRKLHPDLACSAVAGPALRKAGCEMLLPVEDLSVSGLTEVVRHLPRLWRLRRELIRGVLDQKPDLFLGVDAPDFNLGLERILRQRGVRTVHLVSPSVWAWRPQRVRQVARATDTLFCLFPFEPAYYQDTGVHAHFVGHPLADRLKPLGNVRQARAALGLDPDRVTVAILPGSRLHELENLGSSMMQAARRVQESIGPVQFLLPIAQATYRPMLEALWRQHGPNQPLTLIDRDGPAALALSDAAWVASGTATLEGLLVGCPMVVAYRVSATSALLARSLLGLNVKWVSIPNLLAGERLVPECLQARVQPQVLADTLMDLLRNPETVKMTRARFLDLAHRLRCNFGQTLASELDRILPFQRREGGVG